MGLPPTPVHAAISQRNLAGILVEPLPHLMQKLKANYAGCTRIRFAEVAIGPPGEVEIHFVRRRQNLPAWVVGIGSRQRRNFLSQDRASEELPADLARGIHAAIETARVPSWSLTKLCEHYSLRPGQVDVLVLDVEGDELEVMRDSAFGTVVRPQLALIEVCNLPLAELGELILLLHSLGYDGRILGSLDLYAWRKNPT